MASRSSNCACKEKESSCEEPTYENLCRSVGRTDLDLKHMVDLYNKQSARQMDKWLDSLTDGQDKDLWFTNFVCGEPNISKHPADGKFCKNSHQNRMPASTVILAADVLSKSGLDKYATFSEILEAVTDITRKTPENPGIENFGELACYDFSLRYAHHRGIHPEVVYLHAGVQTGFNALMEYLTYTDPAKVVKPKRDPKFAHSYVEATTLPKEIAEIRGAHHIENFLCIFHKALSSLAAKAKVAAQNN